MSFAVKPEEIYARIEDARQRQHALNDKLLIKYREKVNKHLRRMVTPSINIFFKYGQMEVLQLLAEELTAAGFKARAHTFHSYGAHLYIDLP